MVRNCASEVRICDAPRNDARYFRAPLNLVAAAVTHHKAVSAQDSGMLVFFTFMPLGAAIGGIGGALLFGIIAIRDAEIAIEREPVRGHDR